MPPAHHSHASICPPRPTSPTSPTSLTSPTTPPSKKSPHHADKHSEGSATRYSCFLATATAMVFTSVTAAASLFQRGATRVAGYVSRWRSQHKSITPCVSVLQLLQLIFGNIQNPSAHLRIPGIGSHKEKTAATPQSRTK